MENTSKSKENFDFEDFFKAFHDLGINNPFNNKDYDEISELIDKIKKCTSNYQKSVLEAFISENKQKVLNLQDEKLSEKFACACILGEKEDIAFETLISIPYPKPKQREVLGILAYNLGNYYDAVSFLGYLEQMSNITKLAYSLSLLKIGDTDLERHKKILLPICNLSGWANIVLGTMCFNAKLTEQALMYFSRASELMPNSENARLRLLTAEYSLHGKENIYLKISSFYADTCSKLSVEQIMQELEKKEMQIPELKLKKDFFKVACALLDY